MSTSVGVNVLRWSALGFGVFYGFYHQLSISSRDKLAATKREYEHKQSLITQAKAEWAKQHAPATQSSGGKVDPMDPNADLNTVLGITDDN
ncbi:ATP synthase E chain-domain-containing protein [Clohesyomyces aquaticus]|uniref:ATP synthase F(0) complex subunit e, mitochondrial n=1 Tax=Clohesyomyces aquaticus TaxID=1231657 RepID=A0A1Y1Z481_9PLEO|nr:ATP synthase E chain-domain-containing protein [Clohesyomyces aquaticus]